MFSIIVPVYNVEKYVIKCLKSIRAQSFDDYEVIIVDDGSTDGSKTVIEDYLADISDERFKLYSKENGGLSDARNFGITYASGDYLIFVDSDDYIDSELLSMLDAEISKNGALDMIRYPFRRVDENGTTIGEDKVKEFHGLDGEKAFKKLRDNKLVLESACTYCIRRAFWNENCNGFPKGYYHEDFGTIPRLICLSDRVSSLDIQYRYNYFIRDNSIMTCDDDKSSMIKTEHVLHFYYQEREFARSHKFRSNKIRKVYIQYYSTAVLGKYFALSSECKERFKEKARAVWREYPISDINGFIYKWGYLLKWWDLL